MGNVCYTQYRIEGPTEQIRELAARINQDGFKSLKQEGVRWLLYGRHNSLKLLGPEDIRPLNGGWSVLSLEAPSKWSPCWKSWQEYARETVPQAILYYYAEEFGCGVCETNDVWRKYFYFDYVTVLRAGARAPRRVLEEFAKDGECRHREDQWGEYFKYWDERFLRGALGRFVPYRRRSTLEMMDAMDDLTGREDWYHKMGTSLGIYKVKRIEARRDSPCEHCEKLLRLRNENDELYDRLERFERVADYHRWRPRKVMMELVD